MRSQANLAKKAHSDNESQHCNSGKLLNLGGISVQQSILSRTREANSNYAFAVSMMTTRQARDIGDQQSMASRGFANDWVSTKREGGEAKTMRRTLTLPTLILIWSNDHPHGGDELMLSWKP